MTTNKKQILHPAYIMALLCGVMYMVSTAFVGPINSTYAAVLCDDLQLSRSAFSVTTTIQYGVSFFGSLYFFKLQERFKIKTILLAGILLGYVKIILFVLGSTLPVFYFAALIAGITNVCCGSIGISVVVRNWFHTKIGTAQSIAMCFSGVGGVVFSPIISILVNNFGWRKAFFIDSFAILFFFAVLAIFLKDSPEKLNMEPYGADETEANSKPSEETLDNRIEKIGSQKNDRMNSLLMVLIFLISPLGACTVYIGIVPALQDIGYSLLFATSVVTVALSAGNIAGKLLIGIASDKIGIRKTLILWFTISLLGSAFFLVFRTPSPILAIIGSAMIGTSASAVTIPIPILSLQLFKDQTLSDKVLGRANAASYFGFAICMPLFNGLYDIYGNYVPSLIFTTAMMVISLILAFILIVKNKDILT